MVSIVFAGSDLIFVILVIYELVQLELNPPFFAVFPVRLIRFAKNKIVDHQKIHFCTHKAPIGIIWCTYNGFTPYIKAGVYH